MFRAESSIFGACWTELCTEPKYRANMFDVFTKWQLGFFDSWSSVVALLFGICDAKFKLLSANWSACFFLNLFEPGTCFFSQEHFFASQDTALEMNLIHNSCIVTQIVVSSIQTRTAFQSFVNVMTRQGQIQIIPL